VYYGERGWRGGARSVAGDGEVEEPRWFGQFEGVRDPAGLRLPADSCIAGPTPAQAARCAADGNCAMTPPVSAMITCAVCNPTPGIVCSSSSWWAHGVIAAAIVASRSASAVWPAPGLSPHRRPAALPCGAWGARRLTRIDHALPVQHV